MILVFFFNIFQNVTSPCFEVAQAVNKSENTGPGSSIVTATPLGYSSVRAVSK